MVQEEVLANALLGLLGGRRLGEYFLSVGNLDITSRLQARASRTGDLDKAHAAHANRLHPRVVAKARDEDPGPLGRGDDELALVSLDGATVDGYRHRGRSFHDVSHGAPCPGGTGSRPLSRERAGRRGTSWPPRRWRTGSRGRARRSSSAWGAITGPARCCRKHRGRDRCP